MPDCQGFLYAGTEVGVECYCGDRYDTLGVSHDCHPPCRGNSEQQCGGGWALSVYQTGMLCTDISLLVASVHACPCVPTCTPVGRSNLSSIFDRLTSPRLCVSFGDKIARRERERETDRQRQRQREMSSKTPRVLRPCVIEQHSNQLNLTIYN